MQIRGDPDREARDCNFGQYVDWICAFFVLTPIPRHLHTRLHPQGIRYMCSCPEFMHRYVCKHVLCFDMAQHDVVVPPEMDIRRFALPAVAAIGVLSLVWCECSLARSEWFFRAC